MVNHLPSVVITSASLGISVSRTACASVIMWSQPTRLDTRWATGRPTSLGIRLMMALAVGVKRRMRSFRSTKTVPMPVPASRLFMSLLARDRSTTLVCSSPLTVASSSLTDCSSSLEVSSSSLVDCSSSFTDCISSLEDLSSSLEVSSCSLAVWRYSSLIRSSCFRAEMSPPSPRAASGAVRPGSGAAESRAGASSRTIRKRSASRDPGAPLAPRPASGWMLRLTRVK